MYKPLLFLVLLLFASPASAGCSSATIYGNKILCDEPRMSGFGQAFSHGLNSSANRYQQQRQFEQAMQLERERLELERQRMNRSYPVGPTGLSIEELTPR